MALTLVDAILMLLWAIYFFINLNPSDPHNLNLGIALLVRGHMLHA